MSKNKPFFNQKNDSTKQKVFRLSKDGKDFPVQNKDQVSSFKNDPPNLNEDRLPSFERPKTYIPHKLVFAIISALTIGLISGFTMLHLITDQDEQTINEINDTKTNEINEDKTIDKEVSQSLREFEIPSFQAFTLQLGMFSERENAKQFIQSIADESLYPAIWSMNDQHYVFIGLNPQKKKIEALKEDLTETDIEAFIKEWSMESFVVEVTEVEEAWLTDFLNAWEELLMDRESFELDQWQQLLEEVPEQSELLSPLIEQLERVITVTDTFEDPLKIDQFLHFTWNTLYSLSKSS